MNILELNLPTPVLLVWGLPEDAHDSLMFMGGRILTYDSGSKIVAIRLSRTRNEYWGLIGKLSELTDAEILRAIADKGYYFTNPVPEPEYMDGGQDGGGYDDKWIKEYEEAQSKTLPPNTLIFKKA